MIEKLLAGIVLACLVSCASVPKKEDLETFQKGVKHLEVGNKELAVSFFSHACDQNIMAACLYIGRELHPNEFKTYAVMQGMTNESKTVLNISVPSDLLPEFRIVNQTKGNFFPKANIKSGQSRWKKESGSVIRMELSGLQIENEYRIEFYSSPGVLEDYRIFKALPQRKEDFKFVIASCMSDEFPKVQKEMWSEVETLGPDLLLMIGDNTYADRENGKSTKGVTPPEQIWRRYLETREKLDIYHMRRLTPVFGLWDDHDYGLNNGDKTYIYKKESAEIFDIFFPYLSMKESSKGPGVSYRYSINGQNFHFLDGRTFRDTRENKNGTHLGEKQEKWLLEDLQRTRGPSWLIKGDQYFGAYHRFESWESFHPGNLKRLLGKLKRVNKPVVFVSGDRHLAEIMELEKNLLGYKTYELTSSGIHAKVYPGSFASEPSPRQIAGVDGEFNFMFINSRVKKQTLMLDVTSFGPASRVQFSRRLDIKK